MFMLIKQYDEISILADGTTVGWDDFLAAIDVMRSVIAPDADRIALFSQNTYAFMVAATAILSMGKILVVLQNNLPNTLEKYSASYDDYLEVTDEDVSISGGLECLYKSDFEINPEAIIVFYTSGSSGDPKKIQKTLKQLHDEVLDTSVQLGLQKIPRVLSTVSHQHIYGFLFKFIMPMVNGNCIISPIVRYPSHMADVRDYLLISSPAFLSRLEASESIEGAQLVISSGGPLSYESGLNSMSIFNCSGYEIYGSTETGGVAFRPFTREHYFTPFKGVEVDVSIEGLLELCSQYIDGSVWVSAGDRINIHSDGNFSLLGRSDDIVKIEEKRISLAEVENTINDNYPWVERSYVVSYEVGRRIKLAALIVSNVSIMQYDTNLLIEDLTRGLRDYIDPVFVPKAWKIVDNFSKNEIGKISKEVIISAIFPKTFGEEKVLTERARADVTIKSIYIDESHKCFDGHFEDKKIFPAVAQISLCKDSLERGLANKEMIFKSAKFMRPISPGSNVYLHQRSRGSNATFVDIKTDLYLCSRIEFTLKDSFEN